MIVLFIALALLTNMGNSKKVSENNPYGKDRLHPATIDLLDDENYQNIILPEKLEKKLANQEDATVYFFASDCPFCKEATPILTPMAEELGIDLVQYNLLEFKQGWNDYKLNQHQPLFNLKMVKKWLVSLVYKKKMFIAGG